MAEAPQNHLWRVTMRAYGRQTLRYIEAPTAAEAKREADRCSSVATAVRAVRAD